MIISLTGPPGSGKSTVGKLLAKKLNFKRYYIGDIMRRVAKKHGMTLEDFGKLCETDDSADREVDRYQENLGLEEDNFVIEGRTSYFFIPHSIKVLIDVDLLVGAQRIFYAPEFEKKNRNEKKYDSPEKLCESNKERMACEKIRYENYYGIQNCYNKLNFDLVIDSTNLTPVQVCNRIIEFSGALSKKE